MEKVPEQTPPAEMDAEEKEIEQKMIKIIGQMPT